MTIRARLEVTMDADEKDIVARAAALMGSTMAGFVRAAAREKAFTLLDRESRVTQSKRDFAAFSEALNGAFKPNRKLAAALAQAKSAVRRA
jgi:uncharacterized protein (DUF1778 family)